VERKERSLYLIITKRLSISPSPLVYSLYPAFLDLRHSSEGTYAVNPEPSVHDIEKHASYIRYGIQWLGVSHTASIHRGVAEVACRLISTEPLRYGHHRHSHPRSKKKTSIENSKYTIASGQPIQPWLWIKINPPLSSCTRKVNQHH
jgi:hypothetical protein